MPYLLDELSRRWSELIDETEALRRGLGFRPWHFYAWEDHVNPHQADSDEYRAFEEVRARGIEIEKALDELRPQIDAARDNKQ